MKVIDNEPENAIENEPEKTSGCTKLFENEIESTTIIVFATSGKTFEFGQVTNFLPTTQGFKFNYTGLATGVTRRAEFNYTSVAGYALS